VREEKVIYMLPEASRPKAEQISLAKQISLARQVSLIRQISLAFP
jgi:hypothetical protein